MQKTNSHRTQKKRHGLHHSRSHRYHKVYLPYLPSILFLVASLVVSNMRVPIISNSVLAYATEMSASSLLAGTNEQRSANGKASLSMNSKLSSAAQAKANDMAERDYWSHNTPDGQEPWVFINQAGYKYYKAGENLAYGFTTSGQTISGWMNSASHKANMLDNEFTEVGFGFTNAPNYQGQGNQTIIVAMYGRPQTLGASSPAPAPAASAPAAVQPSAPATKKSSSPAPAPAPASPTASSPPTSQQPAEPDDTSEAEQVPASTSVASTSNLPQQQITRLEALTHGRFPWATFALGLSSGVTVMILFASHGVRLHKVLRSGGKLLRGGQKFVYHHPVLDLTIISFLLLTLTLAEHIGVVLSV